MNATGNRGLLVAALLLVASLAGGCASETAQSYAYNYNYDGAGQQYRNEGEDVPSAWQPANDADSGDDRLASAPPPTRADGSSAEYRETYVYRGGRDPHTGEAPNRLREGS